MSTHNLGKLFYPRAIAVVGASNRDGAPGHVVMHNLLQGGFEGPIMPVSGEDRAVAGVLAYPRIDALPLAPDLAVVCSETPVAPSIIRDLGERGTGAVILLGQAASAPTGESSHDDILREAKRYRLRILGPACLGAMVPGIGLNASVNHVAAIPGPVAFVSQSSTICNGVLDWARERDIGFSYFISLGDTSDIDVADIIDYLGNDAMTRAVLLYLETIGNGRKFMSASRGAARNKPIIVIKSGRTAEGQRTVFGDVPVAGSDAVYEAAIRRAGMLRVHSFNDLFVAVETLARSKPLKAERLGMIANGRGIAALAVDTLILDGGSLACLSDATREALAAWTAKDSPVGNPVTLDGDAPPEHYKAAAEAMLADPKVDALMVVHAPTSAVSSTDAAEAVITAVKQKRRPALTSWMGGTRVAEARHRFGEAGIPTYDTPTQAVQAFMHMFRYRRNQAMLMETPPSTASEFTPATDAVRIVIEDHLAREQTVLRGREAKAILSAYGIPTAEGRIAKTPNDAAAIAKRIGFPVALRMLSPDTSHRAEAGSVDLFLETDDSVKTAAESMLRKMETRRPQPLIEGFSVERMVQRPGAQEVMIGVAEDPIFGPVITFGHGGPAAQVIGDRAVALPPLNMSLARELISRTRVCRLLQGYGGWPQANMHALCLTLVQVSQMIVDLPEVAALEINPLFVDDKGVFAAEAWVRVVRAKPEAGDRIAIRPYPKELEEDFVLANGRKVLLRPIRPEDEPVHYDFLSKVTPEDIRLRFFHLIRQLPHAEMARLTQIDYDREMAFIATAPRTDGHGPETLGVVRTVTDPNNEKAEYAILVRSDLKGQGLGSKLMEKMVRYCTSRGTREMNGLVMRSNKRMLDLVYNLGFTGRAVPEEDVMEVTLPLQNRDGAADDTNRRQRATA
jgi:acetyltransferase